MGICEYLQAGGRKPGWPPMARLQLAAGHPFVICSGPAWLLFMGAGLHAGVDAGRQRRPRSSTNPGRVAPLPRGLRALVARLRDDPSMVFGAQVRRPDRRWSPISPAPGAFMGGGFSGPAHVLRRSYVQGMLLLRYGVRPMPLFLSWSSVARRMGLTGRSSAGIGYCGDLAARSIARLLGPPGPPIAVALRFYRPFLAASTQMLPWIIPVAESGPLSAILLLSLPPRISCAGAG